MPSRRDFLHRGALVAAGLSLRPAPTAARPPAADQAVRSPARGLLDLRRPPDGVRVETAAGFAALTGRAERWEGAGVTVAFDERPAALRVTLAAPAVAVRRLHLRWRGHVEGHLRLLGDAWERGYGDLEWRGLAPDRVMPWYVVVWDGERADAYGVRTGAAAFCCWQVDPDGISLWTDVRSGGAGVALGGRTLAVCDVVSRRGEDGETAFAAARAFCRQMCAAPLAPPQPVYGTNDWYWAYGNNSADSVLTDARHVVDLSPPDANRPFAVIDDGWQPERGAKKEGVGVWDRGNERFPDMPGLAAAVRRIGARPGIWNRPLLAPAGAPATWRLPRRTSVLDPTVPEVLDKVAADVARLREWGFELVKHDYTTFDVLGRWGFRMGAALTDGDWTFATGAGRTTAEVLDGLYRTIRAAAGDALVIGCNTVSHLSAGRFEICRIGDDTSGTDWDRTRRMGVNSLAFRAAQHGAFYAADPDCVGVTTDIPWARNRQWLDLISRSGTPLFASLAHDALGEAERRDLRAAFARAARPRPLGEPLDWLETTWPARWRLEGAERAYDWSGPDGMLTLA
jgi:alpha-galactosidase